MLDNRGSKSDNFYAWLTMCKINFFKDYDRMIAYLQPLLYMAEGSIMILDN